MSEYEFFSDDLKAQIPKLYSQEGNKDPTVYMKLFTPWSNWTWFITEGGFAHKLQKVTAFMCRFRGCT